MESNLLGGGGGWGGEGDKTEVGEGSMIVVGMEEGCLEMGWQEEVEGEKGVAILPHEAFQTPARDNLWSAMLWIHGWLNALTCQMVSYMTDTSSNSKDGLFVVTAVTLSVEVAL